MNTNLYIILNRRWEAEYGIVFANIKPLNEAINRFSAFNNEYLFNQGQFNTSLRVVATHTGVKLNELRQD